MMTPCSSGCYFIIKEGGARRREGREGMVRGLGMDMYTLLFLKWITTRACCIAQGTLLKVMWQPEREESWGRMNACICMVEFLFCPPEISDDTDLIGCTPM